MEFFSSYANIISIVAAFVSIFGVVFSARDLNKRLAVEKSLAKHLAVALRERNIDARISVVDHNKISIKGQCEKEDFNRIKSEIDSALKDAINNLVEQDRILIVQALEQPSEQGRKHYFNKILENSLDVLKHRPA